MTLEIPSNIVHQIEPYAQQRCLTIDGAVLELVARGPSFETQTP